MALTQERIEEIAEILNCNILESSFGGKPRGRFCVSRNQIKDLLGVSKLYDSTINKLYEACLEEGLIMIDLDDSFAFIEEKLVSKYRKAPSRIINNYTE